MSRTETSEHEPYISVTEAAAHMSMSKRAIQRACMYEKLRHVRVGGGGRQIRTKRSWLEAWCREHEYGVEARPLRRG